MFKQSSLLPKHICYFFSYLWERQVTFFFFTIFTNFLMLVAFVKHSTLLQKLLSGKNVNFWKKYCANFQTFILVTKIYVPFSQLFSRKTGKYFYMLCCYVMLMLLSYKFWADVQTFSLFTKVAEWKQTAPTKV